MRAQGTNGAQPPAPPDRDLWRRSQNTETPRDEDEYLLELSAYADGRLDEDDSARIAALIAHDDEAAADVAAARVLAAATMSAADAAIVARAQSLVGTMAGGSLAGGTSVDAPTAELIAFPARSGRRPWFSAASWSSLAAAMVLAGWLGFDLGTGISASPVFGRQGDDVSAADLLDAAPLLLREYSENSSI